VIFGSLRELKASYGKNLIAFRGTGGEKVLEDETLVSKIVVHADEKEIHLAENADSQKLLRQLIENGATISKFEQMEPSLNDIFIEKIKN
jgi:ABC-2 type transport system ATP-binding protein